MLGCTSPPKPDSFEMLHYCPLMLVNHCDSSASGQKKGTKKMWSFKNEVEVEVGALQICHTETQRALSVLYIAVH